MLLPRLSAPSSLIMHCAMNDSSAVFRLDTFVVPVRARAAFLPRVLETHPLLREQPGFDPQRLMHELGIVSDLRTYHPVAPSAP